MDVQTGARQPFATVAPPDATGADWIHRVKVATDGTTIGFSYSVRRSKALMLTWGDGSSRR